jgi:flagellar protein FlaI
MTQSEYSVESSQSEQKIFSDYYTINPPFGNSGIFENKDLGRIEYLLMEPYLDNVEIELLTSIKTNLIENGNIPYEVLKDDEKISNYLNDIIEKEFKHIKDVSSETKDKIVYYIKRDFLGYGSIDLLIRDDNIEDVSCNGLNIPVYVWHKEYESIPTNVTFESEKELKAIITRLAYKSGIQISVSRPIAEGILPNGYRVHLTLQEVSKRGHTFTIRKLRQNPFTIIDLIKRGTIDCRVASYLWCLVENGRSIMVSGATGSGKTTLLNSICSFIKPEMKVVTIEDVQELHLHQNWIPMVARTSFQPGVQEITLFDLLKSALRQRPDYIILGEIRGEEAYTLFQSIATGHGGICSIHSDSVESTIKRLSSRPLNIPNYIIPLMNVIIQIRRISLDENLVRCVTDVAEITGNGHDGTPTINKRFTLNPDTSDLSYIEPESYEEHIYKKISEVNRVSLNQLIYDTKRKETILRWMVKTGKSSYDDVSAIVRDYYLDPDDVYEKAEMDL